jgi:hypothetical protein
MRMINVRLTSYRHCRGVLAEGNSPRKPGPQMMLSHAPAKDKEAPFKPRRGQLAIEIVRDHAAFCAFPKHVGANATLVRALAREAD